MPKFLRLYCLKFLFKLDNISRSYEEHIRAPFSRLWCIIDVFCSLCMCVVKFFKIVTPVAVAWFLWNLAHMIYVPIRKKTVEQIFEILILNFFVISFF